MFIPGDKNKITICKFAMFITSMNFTTGHDLFHIHYAISFNTELNDLRIIICLRKSEFIVESMISVCNVIEKLMEYGIH